MHFNAINPRIKIAQNYLILFLILINLIKSAIIDDINENCRWPVSDTLFVIDSTVNVATNANHAVFLNFMARVSSQIVKRNNGRSNDGISTLAAVQFTPEARFEFGFGQHEEGLERLQKRIRVNILFSKISTVAIVAAANETV